MVENCVVPFFVADADAQALASAARPARHHLLQDLLSMPSCFSKASFMFAPYAERYDCTLCQIVAPEFVGADRLAFDHGHRVAAAASVTLLRIKSGM